MTRGFASVAVLASTIALSMSAGGASAETARDTASLCAQQVGMTGRVQVSRDFRVTGGTNATAAQIAAANACIAAAYDQRRSEPVVVARHRRASACARGVQYRVVKGGVACMPPPRAATYCEVHNARRGPGGGMGFAY